MYHYFVDHHNFVLYELLTKPKKGRTAGTGGFMVLGKGLVVKDTIVEGQ